MGGDKPGFTLVIKSLSNSSRFDFSSNNWGNTQTLNSGAANNLDLDTTDDSRLRSWSTAKVDDVRVGLFDGFDNTFHFADIDLTTIPFDPGVGVAPFSSLARLFQLLNRNEAVASASVADVASWSSLLHAESLAGNCPIVGLNLDHGVRVRLGMSLGSSTDCSKSDHSTFVGLGASNTATGLVVGNEDPGLPLVFNPAFGVVLVRSNDLTEVRDDLNGGGTFATCLAVHAAGWTSTTATFLVNNRAQTCP
jgi:hypothetical protein